MSAVRFPAAEGEVIVCDEQTHESGYSRPTRIAVRYVVAYWESTPGVSCSVKVQGREQPLRVLLTIDELDEAMAAATPADHDPDVVR